MTLKNNNLGRALFYLLSLAFLNGCAYSFSGSSLPPEVQTFTVSNFSNNSGQGPAILSQAVTNTFRDYFQRNTNLKLARQDADLVFEGQIIGYDVSPVAPQVDASGQDVAARNRLTIRLQVKYTNNFDPKQSFDQTFSAYSDFPQEQNINDISEPQIRLILNQMLTDIFNRSVANW